MFKDFAIYDAVGAPDPTVAYVRNGAEVTSGGVGNAWTRPHMTFVPERDSSFVAVGARVSAINQSTVGSEHLNAQHFTKWQLERAQSSYLPREYSPAHEVQVIVKPDLMNLISNPSFETSTTGWQNNGGGTITRPSTGYVGTYCLRCTWPGAALTANYYDVPCSPSTAYAVAAQVRASTTRGAYCAVQFRDSTTAFLTETIGTTVTCSSAEWTRVSAVTPPSPATATSMRVIWWLSTAVAANDWIELDGVIAVAGTSVPNYFDGASGDDYLWEAGGTAHNARSYYYENRLDRGEAITRAIRDAVPLGIGVGAAQFGVYTG